MAALSFSPSPPPATTTQRSSNNTSSNNNSSNHSKENTGHQQVKSLGVSKPFQKMTVHNVLSESGANALQQQHFSNQNTIIRKIKDFGMLGTVHNATAATTPTAASATSSTRKRPLGDAKCNVNGANKTPAATKRTKLSKKSQQQSQQQQQPQQPQPQSKPLTLRQQEKLELINRPAGTPGRKGLPLPQAVARRNARERNRVKQVNNGFAALRERIPEEVSEAFEAQGAGRGASKKLSKVETLRMAVEYIRSLERLLGFDFPPLGCSNSNSSSSGDDSFMFIKDEFDGLDEQFDDSLSNYELDAPHLDESHSMATTTMLDGNANGAEPTTTTEEELLPSVTTLNGLQYVRIPGTSTYQLLTPDMLTASGLGAGSQDSSSLDEEHFNALIATNCLSSSNNGVAAAPAAPSNGECVKFTSTLSRSPVPLTTTTTSPSSSPATTTETRRSSSSLHQPPNDDDAAAAAAAAVAVAVAVSPVAVAVANELLLQACAAQQQQQQQQQQQLLQQQRHQQQQQLIKQEYSEGDFRHVANNNNNNNNCNSPPAINNNFQQQQQQQQLLCSPVLPAFYDQEPATSFYDNVVVGLPSFKKEFTDVLHDQSTNTAGGCLSDESMIDAIDWWEAHTPKSDAGTVGGL